MVLVPDEEDETELPEPPAASPTAVTMTPPPPPAPVATQQPSAPAPTQQPAAPVVESDTPVNYGQIAEMVLDAHKFLLPSAAVEKRLLSVLSAFGSRARDRQDAYQGLIETVEQGGVGFSQTEAEAALATTEEIRERAERDPEAFAEEMARRNSGSNVPTFEMAQQRIQEKEQVQTATSKALPKQPAAEIEDIFANVKDEAIQPLPDPNVEEQRVVVNMPEQTAGAAGQSLIGPLDELRTMSLEEFRSYSTDPAKASQEVLERIHTMEQESISKKAEAIQAWKASPLNQLYLKVGNYSLETTLPVESAIRDLEKKGESVMTLAEFDAIADINKQVRF